MDNKNLHKTQLAVGWITLFVIGTDLFIVSPLLPAIGKSFGLDAGSTGWLVTAFSIAYAISAPVFGGISDKWGRRKIIAIGLTGFACANLLTGLAEAFWLMMVSRVLAGIAASMVTSSIFAAAGDIAPAGKSGKWLSIVTSGFLTALWAGTPIGALGSHLFGYRSIFIGLSVVCFIMMIGNHAVWPDSSNKKHTPAIPADKGKRKPVLLAVVVTMFWAAGMYGVYTYLGTGLENVLQFSGGSVSAAIAVYGLGAITGSLSGGWLADKWRASLVTVFSLLALGVALIVMGAIFTYNSWIWVLLFVWPLAGYVSFSSFQAYLSTVFTHQRGMAMAWNQTAMYVGISLGSVIGGRVIHQYSFALLPVICGVIALCACPWMMWRMGSGNENKR